MTVPVVAVGAIYGNRHTRVAADAVYEGRGVVNTAALNTVSLTDVTATDGIAGIALQDVATGKQVTVMASGQYDRCISGGAISAINKELAVDNDGKFVEAASTDVVVARSMTTTTGADKYFAAELYEPARQYTKA